MSKTALKYLKVENPNELSVVELKQAIKHFGAAAPGNARKAELCELFLTAKANFDPNHVVESSEASTASKRGRKPKSQE